MPNIRIFYRALLWSSMVFMSGVVIQPALAAEHHEQTAVFAEGCFWDVEALFRHVKGVTAVEAGYAGGQEETAHYDLISKGGTGHAESVRVHFNPDQISYQELLTVYFSAVHDPSRQGRPGTDAEGQYRSVIFFVNQEQQQIAQDYMRQLNAGRNQSGPVSTQLVPLQAFYRAEDFQQNHLERSGFLPYGSAQEVPRIKRLRLMAPELYQ